MKRIAVNLVSDTAVNLVNHSRDGFEIHFFLSEPNDAKQAPSFDNPQLEHFYHRFYRHWLNNLKIASQMTRGIAYDAVYMSRHFDMLWVTKVFEKYEQLELDFAFLPKVPYGFPSTFIPNYDICLSTPGTAFNISLIWKTLRVWDIKEHILRDFSHRFEGTKFVDYQQHLDRYLWHLWCTNLNVRVRQ